MSDIEAINETNNEARMPDNEAIESTTIEKPKRPRTEKQLEAFKKVQEKRKQNIELKKSGGKVEPKPVIPNVQKELPPKETKVKKYKEVIEEPESESEEEIIIKRKPKKQEIVKKKKKQIVIELSDTDSDSEEEQPRYEEPKRHVETKSKFIPQQHKKYSVDVKPKPQQNFFCD
ncbi:MAG: hypothetical protein GY756_04670 [bacterium]|nr:hypothetical protein [bacterium]